MTLDELLADLVPGYAREVNEITSLRQRKPPVLASWSWAGQRVCDSNAVRPVLRRQSGAVPAAFDYAFDRWRCLFCAALIDALDFTHHSSATFDLLPVHSRTSKNLPEGAWLRQRLC